MTFLTSAKDELARIRPKKKEERLAELSALMHTAGFLQLGGGMRLRFQTDSHQVAIKLEWLAGLYSLHTELYALEKQGSRRAQSFDVLLSGDGLGALLQDTGLFADGVFSTSIDERLISTEPQARAFLRGAFLGGGYVANPNRSYHFEIVLKSKSISDDICKLCNGFGIFAKQIYRKGSFVVYLKDSEEIADFFGLVGASSAVLDYHNIRILKEIRNNANRVVNCDSANLNKAVSAALRQMRAIEILESEVGLESLPPALYETALMRKRYPEATLIELVELDGMVGKSGLYHRLSKLEALANEIEIERGSR